MHRYPSRSLRHLATWAVAVWLTMAAAAAGLEKPTGDVILTVTGKIARTNAEGRAEFDRAMLEDLGSNTLQTWTPWTEGRPEFTGVLAKTLMDHVGAEGEAVEARALNDYEITIPLSDFDEYPVLVAMAMDGEPLRTRDKGPLWLIYPWSDHPELDDRVTRQKSVWQLRSLHVK
jgi:hypothetical protein